MISFSDREWAETILFRTTTGDERGRRFTLPVIVFLCLVCMSLTTNVS